MSSPTSVPYEEQDFNKPEPDEQTEEEVQAEDIQPDDAREDALSDAEGRE